MTAATDTTIIIIGGESGNLGALEDLLTRQGYAVRSFSGGREALASARAQPPDLILLDLRIPAVDGIEICTHLKSTEHLQHVPVLFLSAAENPEEKARAFELGAADFITKSFQSSEVLARIDTHLSLSRCRRELERFNHEMEVCIQDRVAGLHEINQTLEEAEKALRQSSEFNQAVLKSLLVEIAVLDRNGEILAVNESWMQFARENEAGAMDRIGQGANYLAVCKKSLSAGSEEALVALAGIASVLQGRRDRFEFEYGCHSPSEKRWFLMIVTPFKGRKGGVIVTHRNITQRKKSEIELKEALDQISRLKNQIEADYDYLQEEIKLEHDYEHIIGNSDEIKYTLYRLEQVAKTDSTVIILGETGTGKELIARALHSTGSRADRPLIKVNCATLPAQFIESELFGHVKGAFTDAVADRQGRFALADKGTLFLDEIGELPLDLQPKLLRVLQDGEFERLGDSRSIKTDVRVIAATNRDLEAQVQAGKFRKDLWYRLNVFPITIPPLRKRKADIPALVNHFTRIIAKRTGKNITHIPERVLNEFSAYDWPGNVRELEHVIERAIITSPGNRLQLMESLAPAAVEEPGRDLKSHADMEREHLVRVLEQTRWVIDGPNGAARILKIHPNTLRYRMKKLNLRRPV